MSNSLENAFLQEWEKAVNELKIKEMVKPRQMGKSLLIPTMIDYDEALKNGGQMFNGAMLGTAEAFKQPDHSEMWRLLKRKHPELESLSVYEKPDTFLMRIEYGQIKYDIPVPFATIQRQKDFGDLQWSLVNAVDNFIDENLKKINKKGKYAKKVTKEQKQLAKEWML